MWVGTRSGVTSAGIVISSARGGTLICNKEEIIEIAQKWQQVLLIL